MKRGRMAVVLVATALTLVVALVSAIGVVAQSPSPAAGEPSPAASVAASSAASPAASPEGPALPPGPQIFVFGQEYSYQGLPTSVPVGTQLRFSNRGSEVHEMVVVRRNEGTTESWEELLQLPEEEALTKVTLIDGVVALPGQAGQGQIAIPQEGDYLVVCFIPQGTTSLQPPGSPAPGASPVAAGPPHFTLGMWQQFTVTAAGSSPGPIPSPAPAGSPAASAGASPAASGASTVPSAAASPAESPAA
jgi:hypothetical protein